MRVLVACECSGRVRDAFGALGWEAWSADLLPCEVPSRNIWNTEGWQSNDPEINANRGGHYQGDCRDLFNWNHPINENRSNLERKTSLHQPAPPLWDLIIAHPPCTDLSYAGARWFKQKQEDGRQKAAAEFFMDMVHAPSPLIAVENPHSVVQEKQWAGPPTQVVEPYMFGDPFHKGIHLWLKGLPKLVPDNEVVPLGRVTTGGGSWRTDKAAGRQAMSAYEDSEGRANRAKVRSRTFPGLARAMAAQWDVFAGRYAYETRKY